MRSPHYSIAFSIGQFDVHYYGIIMFFAILAGIFVVYKTAKRYYKDVDTEIILGNTHRHNLRIVDYPYIHLFHSVTD